MIYSARSLVLLSMLAYLLHLVQQIQVQNQTRARDVASFAMAVEDIRPGMKGYGRLILTGGRPKSYHVQVLRVARNVSPGCDLVLCLVPQHELDRAEQDMLGGSPVFIGVQMLGTVACISREGEQTVLGVTPFIQMAMDGVALTATTPIELAHKDLTRPLHVGSQAYHALTVTGNARRTTRDDGTLRLALLPRVQPAGWCRQAGLAMRRQRNNGGL